MSETIHFEDTTEDEEPPRIPQNVMVLIAGGKKTFIEWGAVQAVVTETVRTVGGQPLDILHIHLKGGGVVQFGPCTGQEMIRAVNLIFGHEQRAEDADIIDVTPEEEPS